MGLAYVYCDYGDQAQSTENILSVIVKQLLEPLDTIPAEITRQHKESQMRDGRISRAMVMAMLRAVSAAFNRVCICVDALDELRERENLLLSLKELSCHLFLTGRNNVKAVVQRLFEEAATVQIAADTGDIQTLIKHQIDNSRRQDPTLMDDDLEHDITETIVAWSAGKLAPSAHRCHEAHANQSIAFSCLRAR